MKLFMILSLGLTMPAMATSGMGSGNATFAVEMVGGGSFNEEAEDEFDELFGAKKSLVVFERKNIALFENVKFEPGVSSLCEESRRVLTQVATILKAQPDITLLHVAAHTDSRGGAEQNKALSLARARSVVDYLIHLGVAQNRLVAVGHGESKPLVANDSAENRAKNRRTEIRIISIDGAPSSLASTKKH